MSHCGWFCRASPNCKQMLGRLWRWAFNVNRYDTVEVSLLLCDYNFSMFSYIHELLLAIIFTFCNRVIDYSTAVITVISITGLNCAYTEYSDASIFVMYNWNLPLLTVEAEGPRRSAESGKETCLLFQVYLLAIVVFLFCLGWHLIVEVFLSQPSNFFLCFILLAGVLSCRSCVIWVWTETQIKASNPVC